MSSPPQRRDHPLAKGVNIKMHAQRKENKTMFQYQFHSTFIRIDKEKRTEMLIQRKSLQSSLASSIEAGQPRCKSGP